MRRFERIACCAIALGLVGLESGNVRAQFGGGGEAAGPAEKQSQKKSGSEAAIDAIAPFMRGGEGDANVAPGEFCRCVGFAGGETVATIKKALDQPLSSAGMEFTDMPLEQAVAQLQEEYGIPIQLDLPALDNSGLGPDEPVNVNLHNISLRSALRLILKQLQLTYIIANEVLIITTSEESEAELAVCVYDVGDLLGEAEGQGVKALVDAIVSCVQTETWAENGGGEAEIRPMPPKFLIVSQTQAVHEEIVDLLTTIREMRRPRQASDAAAATEPNAVLE